MKLFTNFMFQEVLSQNTVKRFWTASDNKGRILKIINKTDQESKLEHNVSISTLSKGNSNIIYLEEEDKEDRDDRVMGLYVSKHYDFDVVSGECVYAASLNEYKGTNRNSISGKMAIVSLGAIIETYSKKTKGYMVYENTFVKLTEEGFVKIEADELFSNEKKEI